MAILEAVEREASAARAAVPLLTDDAVAGALALAAERLSAQHGPVLEANAADLAAASGALDEGALDRLRLDTERLVAIEAQLRELAALPPLDREIAAWTLPNGLEVSERRIPIGVVGANFEARPNVAVDVAGQLLKSLNGAVLRTGGAALRTVTALVDDVLRPALAEAGLPRRITSGTTAGSETSARAPSRSGERTSPTASGGSPASPNAGRRTPSTSAVTVRSAAPPVRSTAPFRLFSSCPATSTAAFGRASKLAPTTPIGMRRSETSRPFGSCLLYTSDAADEL